MKIVCINKKARFSYTLLDHFSAGLVLKGSEVKSLRNGGGQLKDSYIVFRKNEAFLQKAHISPYKMAGENQASPQRIRKLLLNRNELNKIQGALQKGGMTCIPIKIYFLKGKAKLEIALAKGKKKWDKRAAEKKKSQKKEMAQARRRPS